MDLSSTLQGEREHGNRNWIPESDTYIKVMKGDSTRLPADTEMVGPEVTQKCMLGDIKHFFHL